MTNPSYELIEYLYKDHVPVGTKFELVKAVLHGRTTYIYRLTYTSKNSGKTMCVVAKGSTIPFDRGDTFKFFLRQIVLSPSEQGREFSRLYFLERRARQEEFLMNAYKLVGGEVNTAGNVRVSSKQGIKDTMNYEKFFRL